MFLLSDADFLQNQLFQKFFQSVKWFGSRSGPTLCLSRSGSKLFLKVISNEPTYAIRPIISEVGSCILKKCPNFGTKSVVSVLDTKSQMSLKSLW